MRFRATALVLRGDGPHFCTGGRYGASSAALVKGAKARAAAAAGLAVRRIRTSTVPSFARLHGASVGGGLLLGLAPDARSCTRDAVFRLGVAPHGNVADVYRPNAWGANAPPPQQQEDEGYTVSEALYDAGSSIRASASSWFNWAVGDEGGQQPARPRQESTHEAYEMQPMRRVRDDEPRAAADAFGDDASAAAGDDERVVHGGLAGGGGGEVRRRVRRSGGPGD